MAGNPGSCPSPPIGVQEAALCVQQCELSTFPGQLFRVCYNLKLSNRRAAASGTDWPGHPLHFGAHS